MTQYTIEQLLSLALKNHQINRFDEAEQIYKKILKINPNNSFVLHLYGLVAFQLGRLPRALKMIRRAISIDQTQAVFYKNLAIIYQKSGNWLESEASVRNSLEIDKNDSGSWMILSQALAGRGRIEDAIEKCQKAISIDSENPLIFSYLATLLIRCERYSLAKNACKKALKLRPEMPRALHSLGVIYSSLGEFDLALKNFTKAHKIDPSNYQTTCNLASIYLSQSKFDVAIKLFKIALKMCPTSTQANLNLGICYSELGNVEAARNCFLRVIELDPSNIAAFYELAISEDVKLDDNQLADYDRMLAISQVSTEGKIKINFALGAQFEKSKKYSKSLDYVANGNRLRKALNKEMGRVFNPVEYKNFTERVKATFTPTFFDFKKELSYGNSSPIFIVGAPRSGTTLVDKIISSHKNFVSGGERDDIHNIIIRLEKRLGGVKNFPNIVTIMGKSDVDFMKNSYLDAKSEGEHYCKVTDKTPENYLYLGVISILFPKAKIIWCRRNLRDVAVSCYFQNFENGHLWSFDANHIDLYLRCYDDVMSHWKRVLPIPIHEVCYEDLVINQEEESRKLINFLGVEWESACLKFYKTPGVVRTASKYQVRRPMNSTSINRWRKFETLFD